MKFPICTLNYKEFPLLLHEIPDAPTSLNYRGTLPPPDTACLAVVGSRKYSSYGKQVVDHLISGLRGYPVCIVSGLALGIDALAHKAALAADLHTVAVPGSGLDERVLYPSTNKSLAGKILEAGGALLSEFEPTFKATPWSFPQRNRIMAGMSHATLIIEATEKSGTLITARLATDYNRDLLVVPGSIFSGNSVGPHLFLKLGATPVTTPEDILAVLGFEAETKEHLLPSLSDDERKIIELLIEPLNKDALIQKLQKPAHEINILLTHMEIRGLIQDQFGKISAKITFTRED